MQKKKSNIDSIVIFLTFFLCVFHTFTYLQNYYNFKITAVIFALIVFLLLMKNDWWIKTDSLCTAPLVYLYISVALVIFAGIFFKEKEILSTVGAYSPILIWATLFVTVPPLMSGKEKKRFVYLYLCTLLISIIATLSVVIEDNDAARLLAGAASDALRRKYYEKGVGGYGFVYGCVFLSFGMVILANKEHWLLKLLLWATVIVTAVMIVYASYTTALLLILVEFVLSFYARSTDKNATLLLVIAGGLIILCMDPILEFIYDTAVDMELEWIAKRIGQLLNAESSGSVDGLRRTQLYMRSLETFAAHPLMGGTELGNHSMVFDSLGQYGMIGLNYVAAFTCWLYYLGKSMKSRTGVVFILVLALLTINTLDQMVFLPMVLFILPMMMEASWTEQRLSHQNDGQKRLAGQTEGKAALKNKQGESR